MMLTGAGKSLPENPGNSRYTLPGRGTGFRPISSEPQRRRVLHLIYFPLVRIILDNQRKDSNIALCTE